MEQKASINVREETSFVLLISSLACNLYLTVTTKLLLWVEQFPDRAMPHIVVSGEKEIM